MNDDHTPVRDISAWLPAQRSAEERQPSAQHPARHPVSAARHAHAAPEPLRIEPSVLDRIIDETMLLPVYVTGGTAVAAPSTAPPPKPQSPSNPDKLPSDERNMLIFVSALLALGTLAIVAMALGG